MTTMAVNAPRTGGMTSEERLVVFASSLGTVFEWYDFYIYGTLGVFLAKYFFSNVPPNVGFIFALLGLICLLDVYPLLSWWRKLVACLIGEVFLEVFLGAKLYFTWASAGAALRFKGFELADDLLRVELIPSHHEIRSGP